MPKPKAGPIKRSKNPTEARMIRGLDELALLQDLFVGMLPELKRDLAKNLSATDIAKKYASIAQARIVTTALTDPDSAKALTAAKDIVDRAQGKATERKQIEHSMAQASEEEIDALIASKLKDVTPDE